MTDTPTDLELDGLAAINAVYGLRSALRQATDAQLWTSDDCDTCAIFRRDADAVEHLVRQTLTASAAAALPDTGDPVLALHAVLTAAGLPAQVSANGRSCVVDAGTALRLTHLVHDAVAETDLLVTDLADCLITRALHAIQPRFADGKINLGTTPLPVASHLATLLGAPPLVAPAAWCDMDDEQRCNHGFAVDRQLSEAFEANQVTRDDHRFRPCCTDCYRGDVVALGKFSIADATRLLHLLRAAH